MGQSQSYDLKNGELDEKMPEGTVRGVKRIIRPDMDARNYNDENYDQREEELREKLRKEKLAERELELKKHESRAPIDAYANPTTPHHSPAGRYDVPPVEPDYETLKKSSEVNNGQLRDLHASPPAHIPYSPSATLGSAPYPLPPESPHLQSIRKVIHGGQKRQEMVPLTSEHEQIHPADSEPLHRNKEICELGTAHFPRRSSRPIPAYDQVPEQEEEEESHLNCYSEIRAEKRMVVDVAPSESESQHRPLPVVVTTARNPDFPTYATKLTRSDYHVQEDLHRHPEVGMTRLEVVPMPVPVSVPEPEQKTTHFTSAVMPINQEETKITKTTHVDEEAPKTRMIETTRMPSFDSEPLHRQPEVVEMNARYTPIYSTPSRPSAYTTSESTTSTIKPNVITKTVAVESQFATKTVGIEDQVSLKEQRRSSKDSCHVPNCTHVEVPDEPMIRFGSRRISKENIHAEGAHLSIPVRESELDGVIDLAKDHEISPIRAAKRPLEEKLHYQHHLPTITLERRPRVAFYDKLP